MNELLKKIYHFLPNKLSQILNLLNMKVKGVNCGKGLSSRGIIFIRGGNKLPFLGKKRINIGENVRINSCLAANPIGGENKTILTVMPNSRIFIGNNVGISNSAIVSQNEITIEDGVLIGAGCKIYDTDFHSVFFENRLGGDINVNTSPVHIKKKAFIGGYSIILKGVTVGEASVIAAGSVVTKDVPDGEIWAGNPAKFIKKIY